MSASTLRFVLTAAVAVMFQGVLFSGQDQSGLRSPMNAAVFILDLADDGRQLTSVADGVLFDMDGTGVGVRTGWTQPGCDDAFLVLDLNGNGLIDSGREMLGNRWIGPAGAPVTGIEALVVIQGIPLAALKGPRVPPLTIDREDAVFSKLRLWNDRNHNAASEAGELRSLSDVDISSIPLGFAAYTVPRLDAHENRIVMEGGFYVGEGREDQRRVMSYVELSR